MKIKSLYLALLFICINMQIQAQDLPVTTTAIHKVGQSELKVSLVQPKTVKLNQDNNSATFKSHLKQQINGTTSVVFSKDVTINGINIKAGKYLLLLFPGNDWKPSNDAIYTFPGNDWKPVEGDVKFPGNDWKPKNGNTNKFPGNDWNPKDSKVKFPGNDWKPTASDIKFPGNDWKPVNDLMDSFPGNDWLVVFYHYSGEKSKKIDKDLIAAEILVSPTNLSQPSVNLAASFVYLTSNNVSLNLSWDKTQISIPIVMK